MMIIYSPAKLNLYLKVLNRRQDGYHNIETVFEKIAIFDKIALRKSSEIKILCDNPAVPTGKSSLAYRAAHLVKDKCRVRHGAEIKIFKKIPIASGLGGGSSNVASILTGLNKLWKLALSPLSLARFGKSLGADVSFFLNKSSFAFAEERGDKIIPLAWKNKKFWHLVIYPSVSMLSGDIYAMYAKTASSHKALSPDFTALFRSGKSEDITNFIRNDLERAVQKKEPIVGKLKAALKNIGVKHPLVSGSGSSVFGLFEKRKEAVRAKEALIKRFPFVKGTGWRTFIVPTA